MMIRNKQISIWQLGLSFLFLIAIVPPQLFGQKAQLDSLKALVLQNPGSEKRLELLHEIAIFYRQKNNDSSAYYYLKAERLATDLGLEQKAAVLKKDLGIHLMIFNGDHQAALKLFEEALIVFKAQNNIKQEAHIYSSLGIMADIQGDNKQAAIEFQKSLNLSLDINDEFEIARVENNLAMVWQALGRYDEAMATLLHALELREKQKLPDKVANLLNNISRLHSEQEQFEESISYAQRALQTIDRAENIYQASLAYSHLGIAFRELGNPDSALYYFEKQLINERILEDKISQAEALLEIGKVYQTQTEMQKAFDTFQAAGAIYQQSDNKVGLAKTSFNLGNLLLKQKQFAMAIKELKTALNLFQEIPLKKEISVCYALIAESQLGLGQEKEAYQWLQKHIALKDTLLNEARVKALADMEERYESAKKEKAILALEATNSLQAVDLTRQKWITIFVLTTLALVIIIALILYRNNQQNKQKNQVLADQKAEIESQNERNQLLLKEIHHRVKNNLQTVSSLLHLQTTHLKDASVREAVAQGQHRVESMALIHQKLYQRKNLAGIEMKDYLSNLGESLFSSYGVEDGRLQLEIDMQELELDIDTAVPLGLIVNELLTNTLKYAFKPKETGIIRIAMNVVDGEKLILSVKDNGKGSSEKLEPQGTGFGSRLIRLLAKQLDGEVNINTENGYNTHFEFSNFNQLAD